MDDEKDGIDEPGTVKFQCRLDRELAQIVDDWCEEHDRTRSWIIRRALIFTFATEIGEKKIKKFVDKLKMLKTVKISENPGDAVDEKGDIGELGTVKFQCRLDRELAQIVDDWCEEHDRTRSWIIRRALIFTFAKQVGGKRIKKFFAKLKPINR